MSKFDKIRESFSILQPQKDKNDSIEVTNKAVATKEESVEEEVQRYFNENPKDLLKVNDHKVRSSDAQKIRVNNSKRIRVYEPNTYDDVETIGQEIKLGKIVVVNFKNLSEQDSIRVENFLYGMCYSRDIKPEPIDNGILSYDPQHTTEEK